MAMRGWGRFYGNIVERPSGDGHTIHMTIEGGFSLMAGAKNMLCEDGVERNFFASTGYADSFWTMSGWVNAYGKRLKGFLLYNDQIERWMFRCSAPNADFLSDRHPDKKAA